MAMLLLLDRRPHRVGCAPLSGAPSRRCRGSANASSTRRSTWPCPRWEDDPTFDLDFHVRRYAVSHDDGAPQHATLQDLFDALGPIYERPFDRTRPLWELIELDGPGEGAAIFFRLHHGVADGVGGNAILAALTDAEPDAAAPEPGMRERPARGPIGLRESAWWRPSDIASAEDIGRARAVARVALDARHASLVLAGTPAASSADLVSELGEERRLASPALRPRPPPDGLRPSVRAAAKGGASSAAR